MKKYSIVVFLEDEHAAKIRSIQSKLYEITGSRACLDSWKPHFTVGDGISVTDEELVIVENILEELTGNQSSFDVSLEGFGGLTNRTGGEGEITTPYVLWVEVIPNDMLSHLVNDVQNKVTSRFTLWYQMPKPYAPHVTVAFRDLSEEGHSKGKKYLNDLSIKETVKASHIALVEKLPDTDKEYKRFYFKGALERLSN